MLLRAAAPGSCETISVSDGAGGAGGARRSLRARRLNAALRALTFSSSFAHCASMHLELREKCVVCGLETKDLYRHSRYTDCGKKGYVARSRGGRKNNETEPQVKMEPMLARVTRSCNRRNNVCCTESNAMEESVKEV